MRSIPPSMKRKLASRVQAGDSSPSVNLWVGRSTTTLTEDRFLEKQQILSTKGITKTSIAVCHPYLMRGATNVYVGYIADGIAKVLKASYHDTMSKHKWVNTGFEETAQDISLCFDGTMPKTSGGQVEFRTENDPWVFFVVNGALYGQKINGEKVLLAETNCTAVSAVRAMWNDNSTFDFGLIVFFILDGTIYYRQLIGGEWADAEVVTFGPSGVKWSDISAFRTWDYRVGIQCKSSGGKIYELFTQFMGIGKQTTEHIETDVLPSLDFTEIRYTNAVETEHLELANISPTAKMIYALSPTPSSVYNVDNGTGNYGEIVHIKLDYPVVKSTESASCFSLVDSDGTIYTCLETNISDDGFVIVLTFLDFNFAEGKDLTVTYVPGNIMTEATKLNGFSVTFTPENLDAPDIPVPEPIEAWNTASDGTDVALKFSQPLIGDITGTETPVGYTKKNIDLSKANVTSLNQYSSSYQPSKVIDGDISSYWRGTTQINWLKFELVEPKCVTAIRMYLSSYYIKTFTVSGSDDGETWTQIGGEYTATNTSTARWNTINIENNVAYKYYRIDTLTTYNSSRVYVYEVEFQETVPAGNERKISVSGQAYLYVPNGPLVSENRTVVSVIPDENDDSIVHLKFDDGNIKSLRNLVGPVAISYAGGTFRGLGGPVADFTFEFTPEQLMPVNNPAAEEHIETTIRISSAFTKVYYSDAFVTEHVDVNIAPTGALTRVDDI